MAAAQPKPPRQITAEKFARMEWDPGLRERRTTTDYIASALRTAIYDGQFEDGEELNQVELAQYFNVSRVPIREALRALQSEGLVRIVAHRKTLVVGLTLDEILQLIELRAVLESHLVFRSAPKLDARTLQRLNELCDEMDTIADFGSNWVIKNWEFHRTLYSAGSKMMVDLLERTLTQIERYTRKAGTATRLREAAAEHREMVQLIERGEFEAVRERMQEHVLHVGEVIRRYHAEHAKPDTDAGDASR